MRGRGGGVFLHIRMQKGPVADRYLDCTKYCNGVCWELPVDPPPETCPHICLSLANSVLSGCRRLWTYTYKSSDQFFGSVNENRAGSQMIRKGTSKAEPVTYPTVP